MILEFGESDIVATLGLSTFVFGSMLITDSPDYGHTHIDLINSIVALGPLFLGPLSEFYGRRPIYLFSWAMFVIWLIPSAVGHNAATMLTVGSHTPQ
jgi:MFS family permease